LINSDYILLLTLFRDVRLRPIVIGLPPGLITFPDGCCGEGGGLGLVFGMAGSTVLGG